MGFWSDVGGVVSNVITLGGSGKVEESQAAYDQEYKSYEKMHRRLTFLNQSSEQLVEEIGKTTQKAMLTMNHISHLLGNSASSSNSLNVDVDTPIESTRNRVSKLNSDFSSTMTIGTGAAGGGALAVGSWTLVSMIGTASTGTAIGTLSGAAATNATLAWFGGGSLATGGAGMAGGATMIGGIIALPIIAYGAYKAYEKADEIDKETLKLKDLQTEILPKIEQASTNNKIISKQCRLLEIGYAKLVTDFNNVNNIINRYGFLSSIYRWFRLVFTGVKYTPKENDALERLRLSLDTFLDNFGV